MERLQFITKTNDNHKKIVHYAHFLQVHDC